MRTWHIMILALGLLLLLGAVLFWRQDNSLPPLPNADPAPGQEYAQEEGKEHGNLSSREQVLADKPVVEGRGQDREAEDGAPAKGKARYSISVWDRDSAAPIAPFHCRIRQGERVLVDEEVTGAKLAVSLLQGTDYFLEISAEGYQSARHLRLLGPEHRVELQGLPGRFRFQVLDQSSNLPLQEVTFTLWQNGQRLFSRLAHNPEQLQLALEQDYQLMLEKPGYQPSEKIKFRLETSTPQQEHRLFLIPSMQATGVELRVLDQWQQPIPYLQVRAQHFNKDKDKRTGQLWHRRQQSATGIYKLPTLAPGRYLLHMQAVDAQGQTTLHLSQELDLILTGNEAMVQDVILQQGANIRLQVRNANGALLGQDVGLLLLDAQMQEQSCTWEHLQAEEGDSQQFKPLPKASVGINCLTTAAPARLQQPITPGAYTLKLQYKDGPVMERSLYLRAGETAEVEVSLN